MGKIMNFKSARLLLISTATAALFTTPALAFDGQDLLAKINAAYKLQGIELIAKKVIVDGDDVTMTEAGVVYNDDASTTIPLGDISLSGVSEKDGGYLIESINFEDVDFSEKETRIVASDISMQNVSVPAKASNADLNGMLTYEDASISDIEIYSGEQKFLSIDRIYASMSKDESAGTLSAKFVAEEFNIDLTDVKDASADETLNKLQIEVLNGNLTTSGTWNTKNGDLDVEALVVELSNIGTLTMSFGITGYTTQFVESMSELAKETAAQPESSEMAALGALGLAQELGIKNALIHFEDDSITQRIINFMAAEQNIAPDTFTTMIKALVPSFVEQMGMPTLQGQIIEAVNAYLDAPETLSIVAAPKATVLVPELMGTMLGAPDTLPEVLGLSVTAND
jgi:hypothetical protein